MYSSYDPKSVSVPAMVFAGLTAFGLTAASLTILAPSGAEARSPRPVVVTGHRSDPNTITRRVPYGDLNLASLQGERMLKSRVRSTVNSICYELTSLDMSSSLENACREEAWGGARPQINRAVQRARELALTGKSSIAAAAITITFE